MSTLLNSFHQGVVPTVTEWVSFPMIIDAVTTTPTKGTIVVDSARWRRVGDSMEIHYDYRQTGAGSAGSGTYLFKMPTGYSIDTTKITARGPSLFVIGVVGSGSTSTNPTSDVATKNAHVAVFDANSLVLVSQGGASNHTVVDNDTDQLSNTNVAYSFDATVPIVGWDVVDSSNIPSNISFGAPQIVHLYDSKPSGTAGGTFTSGAWQTRDLNTLNNPLNLYWCSLTSNQFTLQPGAYEIRGLVQFYRVANCRIKLRNITSSSDTILGASAYAGSSTDMGTSNTLMGNVLISSATVFEIQYRVTSTTSTTDLGVASNYDISEVYAQVHIRKLS